MRKRIAALAFLLAALLLFSAGCPAETSINSLTDSGRRESCSATKRRAAPSRLLSRAEMSIIR